MTTRLVKPYELSPAERDQMYHLMTKHYDAVERAAFERDLADKTAVIVLETDRIVGFSTQKIISPAGIKAVFSGDTIIDQAHWGSQHLAQAFARHFFDWPDGPLVWFLISKGFKTYRYLPTFFQRFYPRHDQATPPDVKQLIDKLAGELFPEDYNPACGVIEYRQGKDRLKLALQDLSQRPHDPDFNFFVRANPGYLDGHDLACITWLERPNLRPGRERLLFGTESS